MSTTTSPELARCRRDDCDGVALCDAACLAHAPVEKLPELRAAEQVDGRGGRYDAARAAALIDALPIADGKRRLDARLLLDDAVFTGPVLWSGLEVGGWVSLRGARFEQSVQFGRLGAGCVFRDGVDFRRAEFLGSFAIQKSRFAGITVFDANSFADECSVAAWFEALDMFTCTFKRRANFGIAGERMACAYCYFNDRTWINAVVSGHAQLRESTFDGPSARFDVRSDSLDCERARFRSGSVRLQVRVSATAGFRGATFETPARLWVKAEETDLAGSVFSGGTVLLSGPHVLVDEASFTRPATLAPWTEEDGESSRPAPRLTSLAGADVGKLTIDGLDLSICRFTGAHNLDGLRLDGDVRLPRSPAPRMGRARLTIADEHLVRHDELGWDALWPTDPEQLPLSEDEALARERSHPPGPATVARTYRALRKGLEDAKDASGASDFYYGEMEMRRRAERTALLNGYWLLSGYGTKAARALGWYAVLLTTMAVLLHWFGFEKNPGWARAFTFTATSTVFVGHAPGQGLTPGGDVIQLALRVLGPLLLGMALLALRTRVHR